MSVKNVVSIFGDEDEIRLARISKPLYLYLNKASLRLGTSTVNK